MMEIADLIHRALASKDNADEIAKVRGEVRTLTARYPLAGLGFRAGWPPRSW